MRQTHALFACLILASSAIHAAAQTSSDAAFAQDAAQLKIEPIQQAAGSIADHQLTDKYLRQLGSMFSWYGLAEQKPSLDATQVAAAIIPGLKNGSYDVVEFGESHSNPMEQAAGKAVVASILDSGVAVGDFLQEATQVMIGQGKNVKPGDPIGIYQFPEQFAQGKIPNTLMKDQFNPEKDVKDGLKIAGNKVLITYTGAAHTSARMRDYIIGTLKDSDLSWGKIYPGRPVIEQALKKHHRTPVIIAMEEEVFVFSHVLDAAIKDACQKADGDQWRKNLTALKTAWEQTTASFQPTAAGIRFVQSSEQPNFYVGMAPDERRPLKLEAIQKVAAMPELKAWLGDKKIKSVDAPGFSGGLCDAAGFTVSVDKGSKDKFTRTVCSKDLP